MSSTTQTEPVISLTESAANQVRSLLAADPDAQTKRFRVFIEDGGCSGMQYGMVFDEQREGDVTSEWFGVPVVVDAFSAQYLRGAVVDFSDSLTGGGFKISNPNARQSCGCGKSFEA
ncbi:MAG: iron-sulfur cluster assembly accessory protein [Verrucomicrobiota bacterium]|jgi:iron-sulfur cluster assembly protein